MIAVIEQIDAMDIFYNLNRRGELCKGTTSSNNLLKLYNYITENNQEEAFEFHLQNEFPNGTDLDEYESYIMDNTKEILTDLKGEYDNEL